MGGADRSATLGPIAILRKSKHITPKKKEGVF